MKIKVLIVAVVTAIVALTSVRAEDLDRKKLARSIPEDIVFCIRLDLSNVRKNNEAKAILDATEKKFNEQIRKVGEFSGLDPIDLDNIWICVVKDKEVLIVLDGEFDPDDVLNSKVVASSVKLARPGTLVTIEMKDEQKKELNQGTMINEKLIAFGKPDLVDKFIKNFIGGKSGWDNDGLAIMDGIAGSEGMFHIALMRMPEQEIEKKPFLGNLVNGRLELNATEKKVSATAKVTMKDEEKAKALKELVNGLVVLGITGEIKGEHPEIVKAIVDGLKLGSEGKTTTLSTTGIDIDMLKTLLRKKGLELE